MYTKTLFFSHNNMIFAALVTVVSHVDLPQALKSLSSNPWKAVGDIKRKSQPTQRTYLDRQYKKSDVLLPALQPS